MCFSKLPPNDNPPLRDLVGEEADGGTSEAGKEVLQDNKLLPWLNFCDLESQEEKTKARCEPHPANWRAGLRNHKAYRSVSGCVGGCVGSWWCENYPWQVLGAAGLSAPPFSRKPVVWT